MKKMISRRNFLTAAGVVAAAGVLTACGGSSSSTAASSTAASAAGSAAASGDTIKIGVMGPLTGNASIYGQAVVNGASLYLKQVNADGGINGKQIEILTEDEQGDATQAVNCFTKMVDEGITALVGDVTTTPTLAVAAESADYNMPMVTASATAEAVTYDAETDTVNENVFRATFTDPFQGIKMADYAYQKLGYTKAAVIFKKGADYNEGLAENFANEFESLGGTIVDQESYSEGDVDFKTQLTSIMGKGPETVFCPNYYEEVGQILSQAESVGLNVPFLGGDGWDGLEGYATADQLKDSYFCETTQRAPAPSSRMLTRQSTARITPTALLLWAMMPPRPWFTACRLLRMPAWRPVLMSTSRLSSMPLPPAPSRASPAPLPLMSTTIPSRRLRS